MRPVEIGMSHVDQRQFHRQKLPNQLHGLLRLPTNRGNQTWKRGNEGLEHGEQPLFEERTGREDGQIDELEVRDELFFDQSRAVLAAFDRIP